MIPKHCIKKFEERFKSYPSIVTINSNLIKQDLTKFFSKSQLLWSHESFDSMGEKIIQERLLEYDPTGIFIYLNSNKHIFIMTTLDRKGVADYMINTLIKLK